jgi:hypothetical protein
VVTLPIGASVSKARGCSTGCPAGLPYISFRFRAFVRALHSTPEECSALSKDLDLHGYETAVAQSGVRYADVV